jgi:hypothetical protein
VQTYTEVQELLDNTGKTVKENEEIRMRNEELIEELEAMENRIEQLHHGYEVLYRAIGRG